MKYIFLIIIFFITSCVDNKNIIGNYPEDQRILRANRAGFLFGKKDIILEQNTKTGLWDKSINIISSILPIEVLDKKSGLIATDWGSIKEISGDDNLYRINIYIKDDNFDKSNILISVFKKEDGISLKDALIQKKIESLIFNESQTDNSNSNITEGEE